MRVAVIGGGAAGNLVSLLAARGGHDVVQLEQELLEPAPDVEAAARRASRSSAPQIVQPHGIWSRCRELLRARLPDVYESLLAAGVCEVPLVERMPASLEDRSCLPGDEQLVTLASRRSTFDWVLGRAVRADARIDVRGGARVIGLRARPGRPPSVTGVRTAGGVVEADVVVDASGRRSPIDRWLDDIGAQPPAYRSADCGVTYYGRHYRVRTRVDLPGPPTTRLLEGLDACTLALFGADNGAVQVAVAPLVADRRFRSLRNPPVFDAVLRAAPAFARWLDVMTPISDVFQMVAPQNSLRRLVVAGVPVAVGLHAVGDSVCTTNPTFGRGLSMAAWMAADLVDAIDAHPDDLVERAMLSDDLVVRHIVPFYDDQARTDTARLASMRRAVFGAPEPGRSLTVGDRVTLGELRAAADVDAVAFRAHWRLMSMMSIPDDVYTDPRVVAATRRTLARNDGRSARPASADELVAVLERLQSTGAPISMRGRSDRGPRAIRAAQGGDGR